MLHFILAGNGGGKSTEIFKQIKKYSVNNTEKISLIVPEQYSFTSEKKLLSYLGEYKANKIDILTFTSLADKILKEDSSFDKKRLSSSASAILMYMSLAQVKDELLVYSKQAERISSVKEFLSLESEFKQNAISPDIIDEKIEELPDSLLKAKLTDISKILKAYDSKVSDSYFNPENALTELDGAAELDYYLNGRIIFIDSFRGFTSQEYLIISHFLKRCDEVYISLSTYDLDNCESSGEIMTETFAKTKRTAGRLIAELRRNNPDNKAEYEIISHEIFERYKSEELSHLEKVFSSDTESVYEGECGNVILFNTPDIYSECETAAAYIKSLIRKEGFRCRDIAVIARKAENYERPMISALKKSGIDVYEDYRKGVDVSPVINTVSAILAAASDNFSTDSVLRYLKSGLSGLSDEEISEIENYAFVWNINGKKWTETWKSNPDGFGKNDDTADEILNRLNSSKDKALNPICSFRAKLRWGIDGKSALKALWDLLTDIKLRDNILAFAQSLIDDGNEGAARELDRMWDILTETLSELFELIGDEKVTTKKLSDYFEIMLSTQTVGNLPQGLDEIIIGSADRIRISSPRAVVILGANEGVFPPEAKIISALSMKDRERMSQIGLELSDSPEWKLADEKLIVYSSVCCAREKLAVTCSRTALNGAEMNPSDFYLKIKRTLKNVNEYSAESLIGMFYVEGKQPAFEQFAKLSDTPLSDALEDYFKTDEIYGGRIKALERASHSREFKLEEAQNIFKNKINLSASQIETFYKCAFQYFCKYTLRLKSLKEAQLDGIQIGNITHLILEILLKNPGVDALAQMTAEETAKMVSDISDDYIESFTAGGLEGERANYQYKVLKRVVCEIIERIVAEFKHSKFRPSAFELEIGGDEIPAYEPDKDEGVGIKGKIDRVDTAEGEESGRNYLRIIDYKTGNKEFKFTDVLNGLNLQMLIYLFALIKNGKGKFGSFTPAGILYYPANSKIVNDSAKAKNSGTQGFVLENSEAIKLMEDKAEGEYIPAQIDDSGNIKGTTLPESGIKNLNIIVDRLIVDMAHKLREGYIKPLPKKSTYVNPCENCDFKSVCGFEEGSEVSGYAVNEKNAKKIILGEED